VTSNSGVNRGYSHAELLQQLAHPRVVEQHGLTSEQQNALRQRRVARFGKNEFGKRKGKAHVETFSICDRL
jgi:hypothetical protein